MNDDKEPSALVEIVGSIVTLGAIGVILWMMLSL